MSDLFQLETHTDLGPAMKARRLSRAIRQEQLAEVVDVSRYTLGDLEGGKSDPRLSTVLKLAEALGLKVLLVPVDRDLRGLPAETEALELGQEIDLDSLDDLSKTWKGE